MAGLSLKGNWSSRLPVILEKLDRLAQPRSKAVLAKQLGVQALQLVKTGFRQGQAPDGGPWKKPLRRGQPLRDTGRLANSFTLSTGSGGLFSIGTNVEYAPVHQYGARIKASGAPYLIFKIGKRWAKKKSVTIPARPMLPEKEIPPLWERAFTAIILDFYDLRKSLAK